jgi:hypothetical protein
MLRVKVQEYNASPSNRTLKENASASHSIDVTNPKNFETAETLRLKEMYERLNQRATPVQIGDGHYLKIKAGEHKRLWFDHTKTTEADVEYPSEPGKKVHRVKFYVREITNGKKSDVEEEWTTSVRTSTSIIKWLLKGYYEIDITRFGSTKNDTRYECDPVL